QEQLGTSDIVTIVRKYNSRTFGFASRNFYLAFLAALEIDSNPEKFFPGIRRTAPDSSVVLKLPHSVSASRLATVLDMDKEGMRRRSRALLNSGWRGSRHVPRGYGFRVPPHIDLTATLAKLSTGVEPEDVLLAGSQYRVE